MNTISVADILPINQTIVPNPSTLYHAFTYETVRWLTYTTYKDLSVEGHSPSHAVEMIAALWNVSTNYVANSFVDLWDSNIINLRESPPYVTDIDYFSVFNTERDKPVFNYTF